MLATTARTAPRGPQWSYEPKYDGVRVLAIVEPAPARTVPRVWLLTRNDIDKAPQFPAIAAALRALAHRRRHAIVLDGELVALAPDGEPARFEALQSHIHARERRAAEHEAAFVAFDCLADGTALLRDADAPAPAEACSALAAEPWQVRRAHLEDLLGAAGRARGVLRLGETSPDLDALLARAHRAGWEGIIAKDRAAPYACGARRATWQKVKLERRQELVVGGWTEPKGGRPHLGALLVGTYGADGRLVFAGAVGTGFTHAELARLHARLAPLARWTSPFAPAPAIEGAHWVRPELVVEVRFNEWTEAGRLRQPSYVGLREDKPARLVRREEPDDEAPPAPARRQPPALVRPLAIRRREPGAARRGEARSIGRVPQPVTPRGVRAVSAAGVGAATRVAWPLAHERLCAELEAIEREAPDASAAVTLDDGRSLRLTHLARVVIGATRDGGRRTAPVTKGDLLRYYVRMAPVLLPAIADRPLVLRRHTGAPGADGLPAGGFYQQHVRGATPVGVRIERVQGEDAPRFVGGDLATLLHLVQLGAISVDPWHARVGALDTPDYTIVDLDPMPGAPFASVVAVALAVREVLERLGLRAIAKTSGATGLHVVVPLAAGTPALSARLLAELVATEVAERLPRLATIARSVRARPADAVYVDYLQNVTGKSVAAVYSARATAGAGVSTPLDWSEVAAGLDPRDFTVRTVPARVRAEGDRWAAAMARPNTLEALLEAVGRGRGR